MIIRNQNELDKLTQMIKNQRGWVEKKNIAEQTFGEFISANNDLVVIRSGHTQGRSKTHLIAMDSIVAITILDEEKDNGKPE